ncbi:MAG: type II toxin-antitoxin system RelE/ParE family toxin [Acidobacteriota bacterium]
MSRRISFHRLAKQELKEAAHYYDSESHGLGLEFLQEIEQCIQSVVEYPEAAPVLGGPVRQRLARRFPYAVLYSITPARIRVLAVMHLKRRPMYWVGRQ